ncbi:MAG: restriction endonuclease subunit S [Bacteroidetes bacterium]|nr:restriction endonuclease subunit S [Bacteroidota bacterium]
MSYRDDYKRLGDYILPCNEKNTGNHIKLLQGISNKKYFQKAKTNTIGVDLSKYRIVRKGQFAFNRATTRNGDKISIALQSEQDCIVSPSYRIFQSKDENVLNSEYLMMWFRRPEFDRYARFKSHGSAHEFFDYDEMCDVELPVPSIEKQRAIVKEYNTVVNRIQLNEQLNQKLEATAQALYKHWFVDFEFPDENGQHYKSSGGKMVWCEELEKEIPEGWESGSFTDFCKIGSSKRIYESEYCETGIPFYRGKEITIKKSGKKINSPIYISKKRYFELISKYGKIEEGDILLTAVGTIGSSYLVKNETFYFKDGNIIWFKNFKQKYNNYYLYDFMQSQHFFDLIDEITIGSTQSAITIKTLSEQNILIPNQKMIDRYYPLSHKIWNQIKNLNEELELLIDLKEIFLSKMSQTQIQVPIT